MSRSIFVLVATLLTLSASPLLAAGVYWVETGSATIHRADLDGGNVEMIVDAGDTENPGELAIDPIAGKIYWGAFPPFFGVYKRANLDGSAVETAFVVGGKGGVGGIAIDGAGAKAYYTDPSDCLPGCGRVLRSNLDGSAAVQLAVGDLPRPLTHAASIDRLCWADLEAQELRCAQSDGTGNQVIASGFRANGVAIDPLAGKIYWTDDSNDKISRANLDGSAPEDLVTSGLLTPHGIALDVAGQRMYWTDSGTDSLQRASLDGSNVEELAAGLASPRGIALDLAAGPGTAVPTVSEWGLIVMTLMLLATAAIFFGRIR